MQGGRRGARHLLVQALYQHQVTGDDAAELSRQFQLQDGYRRINKEYFRTLLGETVEGRDSLDEFITRYADRPPEQIDLVERAILWLGIAELKHHIDVPVGAVIDEAVRLARQFGAADSYRYVNAVLDKSAAELRGGAPTAG